MRIGSALFTLILCACASRQPAKMALASDVVDAGEPLPARASADAGNEPVAASDAGSAAPGWLAVPPEDASSGPLFARESSALKSFEFSSPDGRYSGRTLAGEAPRVDEAREGGVPQLRIPIGDSTPVICSLHAGPIRPGVRLREAIEKLARIRTIQRGVIASVRVAAGEPLLFVDVLYGPAESSNGQGGELKMAFLSRPSASLICTHSDAGYRKTFEQVVQLAAESTRDREARASAAPTFAEIDVLLLGDRPIGYQAYRYALPRADGVHDETSTSLFVIERGDHKLRFSDVIAIDKRRADGRLHERKIAINDNEATSEYTLQEESGGSYSVSGTLFGQPLAGTIQTRDGFLRATGAERLAIASGERGEVTLQNFSPIAPLAVYDRQLSKGEQPHELIAKDSDGSQSVWTLDAAGEVTREAARDGHGESSERLWSQGTP